MQNTLAERALDGLHDYAIWLRERGDESDKSAQTREERAEVTKPPRPQFLRKLQGLEESASTWENERLRVWREAGRLTSDGTLRVQPGKPKRWTLKRIEKSFPELNVWDRWAVLIASDGIFRRIDMAKDPHQNIREVIEEIVDVRLTRVLREELAAIFGEVLVQVKSDTPINREDLSTLNRGRKHQPHRVRHPKTNVLVTREERDAYLAENPEANT